MCIDNSKKQVKSNIKTAKKSMMQQLLQAHFLTSSKCPGRLTATFSHCVTPKSSRDIKQAGWKISKVIAADICIITVFPGKHLCKISACVKMTVKYAG